MTSLSLKSQSQAYVSKGSNPNGGQEFGFGMSMKYSWPPALPKDLFSYNCKSNFILSLNLDKITLWISFTIKVEAGTDSLLDRHANICEDSDDLLTVL